MTPAAGLFFPSPNELYELYELYKPYEPFFPLNCSCPLILQSLIPFLVAPY
jgi:hypothetical protein